MVDINGILLVFLLIGDVVLLFLFLFFYFRLRKILGIPWEKVEESIKRAEELVKKLEKLEKERLKSGREKTNIKEEVFKLFKKGFSQREIAKHLGLSEAEVEVILSAKKVKQG